ncbi:flagellar basal body rod protein FlgC [Ethanoligenens harbinense]|uniref:Flagellar basal-body rod protein FlgC n=1 Tax=Ethanoligenens harbinense (strain DSM 18485 / JCM 12961 / CGMCC 1.5033 / YUAN-3) TaxID=663278 RepID=E6U6K4_ETHHY|nr:flagellar basal body rod protein FlgC [Ethanoligenens harbinense]ADU28074.1 flagellar basal-body rod protein FlgC [Ethanoligenens harbinense YUAN-3]AVQ97512.1 flagellar basal body rod protein FlgC [Ethanoligenens harbinense YUAN-3]AYF40166.1 flagellar basal body rod protein FlgC [Ethanoligenens harbinense]AYF43007.1 flagellar basal body rod protein FlgC [Ethanoligenens harbinense]QCN93769.1 flagellar basal body rod protein FlgC [Ethanoligenens harbinense]
MFLNALNIPGSGLTAQRLRMDVISENLANQDTTETADGGPYQRKTVSFSERTQPTFDGYLAGATGEGPGGVQVDAIETDSSDFKLSYDPTNPNAGADGYVRLPNVDTVTEMTDLMESSRSYSADVTAFNALKGMAVSSLDIGK